MSLNSICFKIFLILISIAAIVIKPLHPDVLGSYGRAFSLDIADSFFLLVSFGNIEFFFIA